MHLFRTNPQPTGFKFPPQDLAVANSAMVDTQTAPEWIDSDICLRCRTPFSFTNRKHHCRNCGQVFDQQCSAKTMPLPHFGITQEVRVCDGCHAKLTKKTDKADHKGHRHSTSLHGSRHRSARELADAELQRAIQLSLDEVGAANGHGRPGYVPSQPSPSAWQTSEPPLVDHKTRPDSKSSEVEEDDPDLRAAIEASLREANAPKPSAPVAVETPRSEEPPYAYGATVYSQSYPPTTAPIPAIPSVPKLPTYDLEPLESDTILTFNQTVEQVEAQGGKDISRYPAVNELFDKANGLRPKLALSLDDTGRKERESFNQQAHHPDLTQVECLEMLSEMNDKLSQAVKLYDKLLTEQVSHPTWTRVPAPAQPSTYQPVNAGYNAAYRTNGSYAQWSPSHQQPQAHAQPMSPGYQQYDEPVHTPRQTHSPQVSYFNPTPVQEYHGQYPPRKESLYAVQQIPSAPSPAEAQPHWNQQPQQAEQQLSQQPQHVPQPSFTQPPLQHSESSLISAPPPPAPQYNLPQTSPLAQTPTLHQSPPLFVIPQSSPPAPISQPQHPAPSQSAVRGQTSLGSSASSGLTRHNTTSFPPSRSQHSTNTFLSRHNTVAAASPPQVQQQQQASLPQFPVAPTSAPQSFPLYGPSIPSNVPQPERKEALLIDL